MTREAATKGQQTGDLNKRSLKEELILKLCLEKANEQERHFTFHPILLNLFFDITSNNISVNTVNIMYIVYRR